MARLGMDANGVIKRPISVSAFLIANQRFPRYSLPQITKATNSRQSRRLPERFPALLADFSTKDASNDSVVFRSTTSYADPS